MKWDLDRGFLSIPDPVDEQGSGGDSQQVALPIAAEPVPAMNPRLTESVAQTESTSFAVRFGRRRLFRKLAKLTGPRETLRRRLHRLMQLKWAPATASSTFDEPQRLRILACALSLLNKLPDKILLTEMAKEHHSVACAVLLNMAFGLDGILDDDHEKGEQIVRKRLNVQLTKGSRKQERFVVYTGMTLQECRIRLLVMHVVVHAYRARTQKCPVPI